MSKFPDRLGLMEGHQPTSGGFDVILGLVDGGQ